MARSTPGLGLGAVKSASHAFAFFLHVFACFCTFFLVYRHQASPDYCTRLGSHVSVSVMRLTSTLSSQAFGSRSLRRRCRASFDSLPSKVCSPGGSFRLADAVSQVPASTGAGDPAALSRAPFAIGAVCFLPGWVWCRGWATWPRTQSRHPHVTRRRPQRTGSLGWSGDDPADLGTASARTSGDRRFSAQFVKL